MRRLLQLALVVAHLAAAGVPCAVSDRAAPEPLRPYSERAVHAHGAADAAGALHAPCVCGCDETPTGRLVASPLGAALVPYHVALDLPRAEPARAAPPRPVERTSAPADPVPRPA